MVWHVPLAPHHVPSICSHDHGGGTSLVGSGVGSSVMTGRGVGVAVGVRGVIVSETVGRGVFFVSGEAASAVTQPLNNAAAVTAIVNVSVILEYRIMSSPS